MYYICFISQQAMHPNGNRSYSSDLLRWRHVTAKRLTLANKGQYFLWQTFSICSCISCGKKRFSVKNSIILPYFNFRVWFLLVVDNHFHFILLLKYQSKYVQLIKRSFFFLQKINICHKNQCFYNKISIKRPMIIESIYLPSDSSLIYLFDIPI